MSTRVSPQTLERIVDVLALLAPAASYRTDTLAETLSLTLASTWRALYVLLNAGRVERLDAAFPEERAERAGIRWRLTEVEYARRKGR
jgi:DNA-binding IclR family transcriptional regulator